MSRASAEFTIPPTDPEDRAILHFTSGTTGMPKGAVHVHNALLTHVITGRYVLDFHPDDIFWCTADPGYTFDGQGICSGADIVTPTAINQAPLEQDLFALARELDGCSDEELRHELEVLVRAYDPCISCAVHVTAAARREDHVIS
nr:AMP-binding protein [Geobacter sp.]